MFKFYDIILSLNSPHKTPKMKRSNTKPGFRLGAFKMEGIW